MIRRMRLTALWLLWLFAAGAHGYAVVQAWAYEPVHVFVLRPGDARSIQYEFNSVMPEPESMHCALIAALPLDDQIRTLTVQISPVGDVGSEISYVTSGSFFAFTSTGFKLVRMFEPRLTFGYNSVTYTMDVYPWISFGFLFSGVSETYAYFDFPLTMAMTVSLSN